MSINKQDQIAAFYALANSDDAREADHFTVTQGQIEGEPFTLLVECYTLNELGDDYDKAGAFFIKIIDGKAQISNA